MIRQRKVLIQGSVAPVIPCVQFDDDRFSLRGFREISVESGFVPNYAKSSDVSDLLTSFCDVPESGHPLFMRYIDGEDLDATLAGKSYLYCGGVCIDLSIAHYTGSMRHTKNLWVINYDGPSGMLSNAIYVYPETHACRMGRHPMQLRDKTTHLAQIRLPFPDSKITDGHLRIYSQNNILLGNNSGFTNEGDGAIYYDTIQKKTHCDGFPHLIISGDSTMDAGAVKQYTVTLTDNMGATIKGQNDVYVYLGANEGYIPRRKLNIDPSTGQATFNVTALGLVAGDTMTVEAGFKFYTAAAKLPVSIV